MSCVRRAELCRAASSSARELVRRFEPGTREPRVEGVHRGSLGVPVVPAVVVKQNLAGDFFGQLLNHLQYTPGGRKFGSGVIFSGPWRPGRLLACAYVVCGSTGAPLRTPANPAPASLHVAMPRFPAPKEA